MRVPRRSPLLIALVLSAGLSSAVNARPQYPDFIPAAPVDGKCGTCHVDPAGGSARNAFGTDVESTLDDDGPDWSKLFCLDSDGDGRTNGQELGDPCGDWKPGETPLRTEPLSAPGDPEDAVDVADKDTCGGDGPATCASAATAAGCTQTSTEPCAIALAAWLLARSARRRMTRAFRSA